MLSKNDNSLIGFINAFRGQNPETLANTLIQSNPAFKRFIEANRGKSVEQIAQENGIDIEEVKKLLK
jgi:predicted transposase YdaD